PLHHIPYFRLGTIFSTPNIPLYVFLPFLYDFGLYSPNTYLKNSTLQQWMDIGFLPSIYQHFSPDILQHLPTSFASTYMDIYALCKESGIKSTDNNNLLSRRQESHYFLPADKLEDVWKDMIKFSLKSGYTHFRNVFLLLDAKDLKLMTK
ncbi:hypothetical protein C7212DRAFT_201319, partial [Tuber magnatum]